MAELDRLLTRGAAVVSPPDQHGEDWWILADPEGNQFCAFPLAGEGHLDGILTSPDSLRLEGQRPTVLISEGSVTTSADSESSVAIGDAVTANQRVAAFAPRWRGWEPVRAVG